MQLMAKGAKALASAPAAVQPQTAMQQAERSPQERARAALHEPSPKLTSLEKGMLKALKSRQRPVKHNQKPTVRS